MTHFDMHCLLTKKINPNQPYHKLVFLPVDNDSCDLLIHENQNCSQQGGHNSYNRGPPGVVAQRANQPAPATPGRCQLMGNTKLRSFHLDQKIGEGHAGDGNDDGKIRDESADACREKILQSTHKKLLQTFAICNLLFEITNS